MDAACCSRSYTTTATGKKVLLVVVATLFLKGYMGNDFLLPPSSVDPTSSRLKPNQTFPLRQTYTLLSPDVIDDNIIIGGKSYSLTLLGQDGTPKEFHDNQELSLAAQELYASLPLPKPILVVGMPKAGTSSIFDFFRSSGSTAVHWKPETFGSRKVGACMKAAFEGGKPLMQTCGGYEVWAQMDVSEPDTKSGCYYPQILNLQELSGESPNATFILNRRNFTAWASSVHRWGRGQHQMDLRLARCKPFGPASSSQEDLIQWHKNQVQRVRQFVLDHPSHSLIEVDIQDEDTGPRMAKTFQIDASFWGQSNANHGKKGLQHLFFQERKGGAGDGHLTKP